MSVPSEPVLGSYSGTIRPLSELNSVTLYWDPPVSNGGSPILSYYISSIQGPDSQSPYISVSPTNRSFQIQTLMNKTNYTYMIAASNSFGVGPFSMYRTVQPGQTPNIVQNVGISTLNTLVGDSVLLSWTPPVSDGTIPDPLWYVITPASTNPNDPIFSQEAQGRVSVDGWQQTYTYSGLNLSTTSYSFLVQAVNDPGYSPNTSITSTVGIPFSRVPIFYLDASNYNSVSGVWSDLSPNNVTFTTANTGGIVKQSSYLSLNGGTNTSLSSTTPILCQRFSTLTYASWVRLTSNYPATTNRGLFSELFSGTNMPQFLFRTPGSNKDGPSVWYGQFFTTIFQSTTQFVKLVKDAWTHIAITYSTNTINNTTMVTYINGECIGSTILAAAPTIPTNLGFVIGRAHIAGTETKADIGQTVFFDSVLTLTDIQQIYTLQNNISYTLPQYTSTTNRFLWLDPTTYTSGGSSWQNRANTNSLNASILYGTAIKPNPYAVTFCNTAFQILGGFGGVLSTYTISVWFKPSTTLTGFSTSLICEQSDGTNMNYGIMLGWRGPNNNISNSLNAVTQNTSWNYGPAYNVKLNQWQNVTITCSAFTDTIIYTYINGFEYDFPYTFFNVGPTSSGLPTRIGMGWTGNNSDPLRMYVGDIGSIMVYDTILSPTDILTNYAVEANTYR